METTPNVPTFKTFVNSEPSWKAWVTAALLAFRPYESGAASPGARKAAREILKMKDCDEMKKLYHQAALEFFPRTVAQANNAEFQDNAVGINKAYEIRTRGSCSRENRRNRKRTQEEPEEPKEEEPEEPKEEEQEEQEEEEQEEQEQEEEPEETKQEEQEEEPKADKEETGSDKEEKPANFIEYNTLYTWVKIFLTGGGFYYAAKQVSAPGGGRPRPLNCPNTPRHRVYDGNYDD